VGAHSKIGPSAAKRWMNCPGSVKLSEGLASESSFYAAEGTVAHMLAEEDLLKEQYAGTRIGQVHEIDGHVVEVTDEMVAAVDVYLSAVAEVVDEPGAQYFVEHRFALSRLHHALFGTSDLGIWLPQSRELQVWDYKHGRGVGVDVEANPQLMIYALGVLLEKNLPAQTVKLTICQPRYPHPDGPIRSWTIDALELLEFAGEVAEAAARTDEPDAPRVPGAWCDWCPAAGICPELRTRTLEVAKMEFADDLPYDPETLAQALEDRAIVKAWLKAVDQFAYNEARHGRTPPRHKLVEKRPTKKWALDDESTAEALVEYGFDEADISERKLKSPAQVEKILGRQHAADIKDLIVKESSGLTLVPESDKRPAVAVDAASEFAEEND